MERNETTIQNAIRWNEERKAKAEADLKAVKHALAQAQKRAFNAIRIDPKVALRIVRGG